MSSSVTGPTMFVAVKPEGGVARAVWVANAPRAQATSAPATIGFRGGLRPAHLATCTFVVDINMTSLLRSAYGVASFPARRPDAGAVPGRWGACLAERTPSAACFKTFAIRTRA